jgi:hypothetical protein
VTRSGFDGFVARFGMGLRTKLDFGSVFHATPLMREEHYT